MSPLIVIITIAAYFALLIGIGRLASRHTDSATFFTGGRRMPWILVGIAMIGAPISGVTFISVPGMVAAKGYAYLQMVLGFIVGYVLIAMVLVPMFYKRNLVSIYGYLQQRFGPGAYQSGAWMFFISKMLGASVRFFVVCAVLQLLVFKPLGIPFEVNVIVTIALIWLYTAGAGVKALIWTDVIKSICLVMSVVLCIVCIARYCGIAFVDIPATIAAHPTSEMFHFSNPMESSYFWKQFLAGVFMAIATNGLDQDMMQRNLACRDSASSRKNMIFSSVMQFFVIALFLMLGTLLMIFVDRSGIAMPEKSDELFGLVATHPSMPVIIGVLFVVGLVSAAYSAAGSALTSLTTSFTIDILDASNRYDGESSAKLVRVRRVVHVAMSTLMGLVIIAFYRMSTDDAISAVYTLASYTYGPILGLFVYGLFTRRRLRDGLVPAVCIAAPVLSWFIQWGLEQWFGYQTGFELLLINAMVTMAGLHILSLNHAAVYVEESV
ncbi:MAG: sodium:solute symporter [Firmicutes bacterium]|nr:sodium:solute symporter [Bacillota bacterium]MCM1401699.1 sodium:solute symporter [Bacteroides sp.]MCM1477507.1 sodium:solute symporter [Bacteroides sp.]